MRTILLFFLLAFAGSAAAQSDSTCAVIMRLYNVLDSKDKSIRDQYKSKEAEMKEGTLGKTAVYKSTLEIPGLVDAQFVEGGGKLRMFTAHADAATYEEAVKLYESFSEKLHSCFRGGWTFTEYNEPRELYKNQKLVKDESLLSPTLKYRIERAGTGFRLVMEIAY
jgi:hypothetical protein